MKTIQYFGLIALLGLVGCTPAEEERVENAAEEAGDEIKEAADDIKAEVEEVGREIEGAYRRARDYTYEQRAELGEWAEDRLEDVDDQMERLEARIDEASAETKEEYRETMADLRVQKEWVEQQLASLQDSSAEAWADAKSNILTAMEELENGVQDALHKIDDNV